MVVNKPAAVPDVNTVLAKAAKPETVAVVTTIGEETARQSGKVFMQTVADDNGASWMRKSFYDDEAGLHEFEFALRVWRHDQLRGNQLILLRQHNFSYSRTGCNAVQFRCKLGAAPLLLYAAFLPPIC